MKRIRCAAAGVVTALCLVGLGITIQAQSQHTPQTADSAASEPPAPIATEAQPDTPLFPLLWEDGSLVAHGLVDYEGPYLEDGSDAEVCTAGLLLENRSELMVEFVRVTVVQAGYSRIFEATYLPPGSTALLIDKNQNPYSRAAADSCTFSRLRTAERMNRWSEVYVSGSGLCRMIATNLTDRALPCVRVYYKQLVPQTDIYLGGITYSTVIADMQPGESREILPYHYITGQADILGVVTEASAPHTKNLPEETNPPADSVCCISPAWPACGQC
jgi:hypothetical protein